ncbi:MAG: MFS transporter [Phycisphaerae bacterium]
MSPLLVAALIVLLEALSFGAIVPVLGHFTQQLGGSEALAGLMLALVSIPKIVTNPVFGRASDRLGRKPVLVVNTLGTLAGSILWALSGNLYLLAASRVITGIFSAQAGLAQAVAADTSTPQRRAAALALLGAAFGVAFSLGPIVGGLVGRHFSYAAVGWMCASFQVTSLALILTLLRETRPAMPERATSDRAAPDTVAALSASPRSVTLLERPRVLLLLAIMVLVTVGQSQLIVALPFLAKGVYHFDTDRVGYWFGVIGVLGVLVQAGVIRSAVSRWGEPTVSVAGAVLLAAGFAVLAGRPALAWFWGAGALIGVGVALAVPCLTALLSRAVAAHEQGAINGVSQSALAIGRGLGNLSGGKLYSAAGPAAPFVVGATLALAAVVMLVPLSVARRTRSGSAVSPSDA